MSPVSMLSAPEISRFIFDILADELPEDECDKCGAARWRGASGVVPTCKNFRDIVSQHYNCVADKAGMGLRISDARLTDAWQQFRFDKKHHRKSLPNDEMPDHFKLSGMLAFWLRRAAPVYGYRDVTVGVDRDKRLYKLLKDYGSEYLAFDFGFAICEFFENNRPGRGQKLVPDFPPGFYETISYFMKFKNLSPHAMGIIYRSLFMPMKAKPEPGGG